MSTIIVAYDENRVIGYKNTIPWKIYDDLKLFKQFTLGHVVLMGRNTWESLPVKPLKNRVNIIVSKKYLENPLELVTSLGNPEENKQVHVVDSVINGFSFAQNYYPEKELFVIGGAKIYQESLNYVNRILASEVKGAHEGDAFFPDPALNDVWCRVWNKKSLREFGEFKLVEYTK